MGRGRRSKTISGQRVPIELNRLVAEIQADANRLGRKLSKQDILRQIARVYSRRRR